MNSNKIPIHKNIISKKGNICDYESVEKAIKGCDYVFHTAAYTNLNCKNIDNFYNTNVLRTKNILKAALLYKIKKVIYTSTLSVFGPSFKEVSITESQPRLVSYANDYELTKSMSEELVFKYADMGMSTVILNVSRVYGPGLNSQANFVNKLLFKFIKKHYLIVPDKLNIKSNFVFVDDVVNAHILAMKKGESGEKYIIGGENINYKQLFKIIKDLTNSKAKTIKINYTFFKVCFSIRNLLKSLFGISNNLKLRTFDSLFINQLATSNKAQLELNYRITPLQNALLTTINYLKLKNENSSI